MSYKLNPVWLKSLMPKMQKFALESRGAHFLHKFLWRHGSHLFVVGMTEAGKTQKLYWIVMWMQTTKETVVWLDSGKNGEMLPLLNLIPESYKQHGIGNWKQKPVNIICPKGCDVIISEYDKDQHKYVKIKNHPSVVTVPDAGSAWWAVKKDHINVMAFRRAFDQKQTRINWMAELFTTLSIWSGSNRMPHILPMSVIGDEAHWFLAGEKLTSDQDRARLTELITELSLEDRAYGIRLILTAQGYKNLPPGSRENLINNLLCRGAKVDATENNTLSVYNSKTSFFQPKEGLFVFGSGFTYPKDYPWPFPYFEKPKYKIEYIGNFDIPTVEAKILEEVEEEMIPDMSKYAALAHDLINYEPEKQIGRYEVIPDE
jgi:hypothetical protein